MLCEVVNDEQVLIVNNSEKFSGLSDENDVNLGENEDIASNESDDDYDDKFYYYMDYDNGTYYDHCYYDDINMLSDSESVTSVNPVVDVLVRGVVDLPILGVDCLVRSNMCDEIENDIVGSSFDEPSYDNYEKYGAFGCDLNLLTDNAIIESVKSSTADEDGIRHILLCRLILGKAEAIKPGSKQCHPSSDKFQTGVDDLELPMKLIVWGTNLNTHILPEYVISFKTGDNEHGIEKVQSEQVASTLMPSKAIVFRLDKFLPPEDKKKIKDYHYKYLEREISRHDMLVGFRDLVGGKLLKTIVEEYKEQISQKQLKQAKAMESEASGPIVTYTQ